MLFDGIIWSLKGKEMFRLFNPSKNFPKVRTVNIKDIQMYMIKFEESLKILEEVQKESFSP
jgi:hypothetical protein